MHLRLVEPPPDLRLGEILLVSALRGLDPCPSIALGADEPALGEGAQPALHRPPAPAGGEPRAVAQNVVEVLDRGVGDGMVLVVRVRSADPVQVDPGSPGTLAEVGVLGAVAGVGLAEATDALPGGRCDRE